MVKPHMDHGTQIHILALLPILVIRMALTLMVTYHPLAFTILESSALLML